MNFKDLFKELSGVVTPPTADVEITAPISENAQTIQPGGVFLARKGASRDGHDLIPQAIDNGAVAVVGEYPREQISCPVPYAQVENGMQALGPLSAAYYGYPSRRLVVIGVTGTDGKTTTSTLIYNILLAAGIPTGLLTTVSAVIGEDELATGLHVTTPPAHEVQMYLAQMVEAGMTHAVLETTSHGLAQGRVNGVDYDVAVMTNVTHEHLDFHGTWQQYRRDKARLFEMTANSYRKPNMIKAVVINADDPSADYFQQAANGVDRVILYGLQPVYPVDFTVDSVEYGPDMTRLKFAGSNGLKQLVETTMIGPFNVLNMLAAVSACSAVIRNDNERLRNAIYDGISQMKLIPGRMERIDEGQNFLAIVDFAHTPNALKRALEAAHTMIDSDKRIIAIFGSAGLRDREKRRLMAEVGMQHADICVLTAEDPRTESLAGILNEMAQGAISKGGIEGENFWRVMDRGRALEFGCSLARRGDLVIVCGKGHEQSMAFGSEEYPWDDREALRGALRGTPVLTLPTASWKARDSGMM
jgi:UDP-N-acetylmuramoyl-L-alanyl-D-glutamate--2,6-diaminopimelate ligase